MSKRTIETDTKTFVKFWLVPLGIGLVILFIAAAHTGLLLVGLSIFLALALRPLVRKVNHFFHKHFGTDKKFRNLSAVLAYIIVVVVIPKPRVSFNTSPRLSNKRSADGKV